MLLPCVTEARITLLGKLLTLPRPPAHSLLQNLLLLVLLLLLCLQAAVKRVLSDSEEVVAEDVGPLLKAVVATNKFEREMAALFGGKGLQDEDEDDGLTVRRRGNSTLPARNAKQRL